MEDREWVVQRQQHGGSAIMVRRVAPSLKLSGIFLLSVIVFFGLFFCFPLFANGETITDTSSDPAKVQPAIKAGCPSTTKIVSINDRSAEGYVSEVICYDESHTEVGRVDILHYEENMEGFTGWATAPSSCNLTDWNFYDCIWKPFLVNLSAGLMVLAAMILTLAGSLFDLLIQYVIIGFGGTLHTFGLDKSIGIIWAAFRDIANILIIGMFVFVAISTILSIENYGIRKWIVRLLLVAIFINFSMFLTQLTIDASNYVAYQLFESLNLTDYAPKADPTIRIGDVNLVANSGIAGTFVRQIGLSNVWGDNTEMLNKLATANIWSMLGYALAASILIVLVAAILAYGAYLIATRAILLLFLLLTSSVAVASILLPGELAKQGWGRWKASLTNAAVFAPLIMLFLFTVLTVLNGVTPPDGATGLGDYLARPDAGNAWSAILIFIFAGGLLFISFKFAGDFAKKIGGFAEAATLPALAFATGARFAGFTGRQTVGRSAARLAENRQQRAQQLTAEGKHVQAAVTRGVGLLSGNVAGKSFNAMNTGLGKQVSSIAGGEKGLAGAQLKTASAAGKGGFIADEKKAIETQKGVAKYLNPTEEQKGKIRQEALANASPEDKQRIQDNVIAEQALEERRKALSGQQEQELRAKKNEVTTAAREAAQNPDNADTQTRLKERIAEQRRLEATHTTQNAQIQQEIARAAETRRGSEMKIIPREALQSKDQNAAEIANRRATNIPWRMFGRDVDHDKIAQGVRDSIKKEDQAKKEKERAQKYLGDIDAGNVTPPPATP